MRNLVLTWVILCACSSVWAQDSSQLGMQEALSNYERTLDVKFAFDPTIIELVEAKFDKDLGLSDFLKLVQNELPLSINQVGDNYFTIAVKEATYQIHAFDSLDNEKLSNSDFIVLKNGQPLPVERNDQSINFKYKFNARDTLALYAVGYEPKPISYSELMNSFELQIGLSSPILRLSEITIQDYLTQGINLNPSKQSIDIEVSDLPLLPGETDGDIFASITALPGVTNPDSRAGNIFVRGSDIDQTLILYDNIPIYHKGHYYGSISPYNPKLVGDVEVYRSGFHPRIGDRVGGAIVINSEKNNLTQPSVGLGVNTLFGMGYFKTPIIKDKLALSFGARHSLPSSISSPKLTAITKSVFSGTGIVNENGNIVGDVDVLFEDYHGKVSYKINDQNRILLSGIYTKTEVTAIAPTPPGINELPETNNLQNYGLNLEWKSKLSKRWSSNFTSTYSDYKYIYLLKMNQSMLEESFAINELKDLNVRHEFSYERNKTWSSQFGFDYKWQEVIVDYSNISNADSTRLNIYNSTVAQSYSPFANFTIDTRKWHVQIGARATYYDLLNTFKFTPRFFVNYELANSVTLKGAAGLYNQYLSQVKNLEFSGGGIDNELWTLADNQQGNIIDGKQYMLGVLFHKGNWIFDVESFVKQADNITVYEDRKITQRGDFFTMDQNIKGIDLMLKRKINETTSIWAGYSYSESEIGVDTTDVIVAASKYVQPNVWYLGGASGFKNWKLSAAWKYGSGLNAQSLDIIHAELLYRIQNRPQNPPPNGPPGSSPPPRPDTPFSNRPDRYPSMHSLDLSASYRIPPNTNRKWSATFGLSLINVFNQKILVDQVFRSNNGFQNRYAIGFAPNIMATIEW